MLTLNVSDFVIKRFFTSGYWTFGLYVSPLECHFSSLPGSLFLLFVCFGVCCRVAAPRRVAARRQAFHHISVQSLLSPRFWYFSGWNLKSLVVPAVIECGCLAWTVWELDFKLWLPFYIFIHTSAQRAGFLFVYLFLCFYVFAHRWHTDRYSPCVYL